MRRGQGRGHVPPTGPQHPADSSLHARVGVKSPARHAGTGDNGSLGWGHFRGCCNLLLNLQQSQSWPSCVGPGVGPGMLVLVCESWGASLVLGCQGTGDAQFPS